MSASVMRLMCPLLTAAARSSAWSERQRRQRAGVAPVNPYYSCVQSALLSSGRLKSTADTTVVPVCLWIMLQRTCTARPFPSNKRSCRLGLSTSSPLLAPDTTGASDDASVASDVLPRQRPSRLFDVAQHACDESTAVTTPAGHLVHKVSMMCAPDLSHISNGLLPILYKIDRKPDWKAFCNTKATDLCCKYVVLFECGC